MKKMNVGVITDVKTIEYQEFDIPEITDYEVLYQVKTFALCTVEQRAYSGAKFFGFPFVGGHETSGVIVKVGNGVTEYKVGDKIVATYNYCGTCDYCKRGLGTQCRNAMKNKPRFGFKGTIIGGSMAPYLAVPQWQVVKLDDNTNHDHTALVEPLACCIHSVEKAKIKFAENVLIIGSGIMGYLHLKLALLQGARVIVSEPDQKRREKALAGGAHVVIDPINENLNERIKELTNNTGADVVINTIASNKVWSDAMNSLAPFGRLIGYSSQESKEPIGVDFGKLHSKEYEYIGTVSPAAEDNLRASRLIDTGLIDMEEVIDSRYTSEQMVQAYERAITPNTYRVLIKYD